MKEGIKKGDLVMVVRGHPCTTAAFGGIPFTCGEILQRESEMWGCRLCRARNISAGSVFVMAPDILKTDGARIPLSWLLKINPPAVEDSASTSFELLAQE